jgi:hypothetical protein
MNNTTIIQRPTPPCEWLYKDISEEERWFSDEICRPIGSEPWLECTQAEREKWESEHKPEPEEIIE